MRRIPGAVIAVAVTLLAGVLTVSACRTPTPAPAPPPPELGRFPHAESAHQELACTECHALESVLRGEPARPGRREHEPCDREQCHRPAFLDQPGALCEVCHAAVSPALAGGSPLTPYPRERGRRVLASRFSHAQHLDAASMEAQVGFHLSCIDCHQRAGAAASENQSADEGAIPGAAAPGTMSLPGHAVCARCHAAEAAPAGSPQMPRCDTCHQARARDPDRHRQFIVGDLRFAHDSHELDRASKPIACRLCHPASAEVERIDSHPAPATATCVVCHDDTARTPARLRMQVCSTCHEEPRTLLDALPPRSHLPARQRPEDHTLAFRSDHAFAAETEPERCAQCHSLMSGNPRDMCDECHRITRPFDHRLTWRELDHGSEALARPERCATCHGTPYCVACHSRPPRSHRPISEWCKRHGMVASFRPGSCITCHQQQSCERCHGSDDPEDLRCSL
ncbi:cytochrome c3 family protein [Haliangium ochraceum]|uniref:Uncharacterized protein n=1 Tax=Haliangium ochraceum (strain DSM 14365 / JCM 11303 / SMP-2) TaxID=502025 RepID=D0LN70_HALO1|nr:cytochrome c3 family protein [Haliangium ochraceum]ACY15247.1 hypothetical protein Hoch_2718 [Haliangium ochraceum DSM 14365]